MVEDSFIFAVDYPNLAIRSNPKQFDPYQATDDVVNEENNDSGAVAQSNTSEDMAWLLIIVMVQWTCTEKTCLNITVTTDFENAVLQFINLGAMFIRSFVIFFVVDNLTVVTYMRPISEVSSVFEEEGFLMLTGMEMFVTFYSTKGRRH